MARNEAGISAVGHAVTAEFFEGGSVKTLKDDGGQRTQPSPKAKWVWSSQWLEAGWKWWSALSLTIASILGSVPTPEVAWGWVGAVDFWQNEPETGAAVAREGTPNRIQRTPG